MTIIDQQIFHLKPVGRVGAKLVDRVFVASVEDRARRLKAASKRGRARELPPLLKLTK